MITAVVATGAHRPWQPIVITLAVTDKIVHTWKFARPRAEQRVQIPG
eukprot:CAMPEP_0119550518 /NCGR_PEP_ID=MMETSP1352-20130426/4023_1 /TAXON_ID=265584 /ORGANISM="Stauroneis constricta, Strain CCMP1120" /LENGTH=46 /DNA_ID= /DNA_START= /DNA_END= /DNA_ORIENTATION=